MAWRLAAEYNQRQPEYCVRLHNYVRTADTLRDPDANAAPLHKTSSICHRSGLCRIWRLILEAMCSLVSPNGRGGGPSRR